MLQHDDISYAKNDRRDSSTMPAKWTLHSTSVICGQWNNIAIRITHGNPITLLQLQKDVYHEAKKLNKGYTLRRKILYCRKQE